MNHPRANSGVTLLELLATVSVSAILLTIGVPAFGNMIKNNRMTTNVSEFIADLNYTRSEAIKRGSRVTICIATANFKNCDRNGDWKNGWLIFDNPTGNTVSVANPNDILRVHQALSGSQTTLTLPGSPQNKDQAHVSFMANGSAKDQTSGLLGGWTFVVCDDRQLSNSRAHARKIFVNDRGVVRGHPASDDNVPYAWDVTKCTP